MSLRILEKRVSKEEEEIGDVLLALRSGKRERSFGFWIIFVFVKPFFHLGGSSNKISLQNQESS